MGTYITPDGQEAGRASVDQPSKWTGADLFQCDSLE